MAALEARFVGTQTGPFGDLAATGGQVDVPYSVFYEVTEGMISTIRAYVPIALMRAQLAPAAGATPGAVRQPASA